MARSASLLHLGHLTYVTISEYILVNFDRRYLVLHVLSFGMCIWFGQSNLTMNLIARWEWIYLVDLVNRLQRCFDGEEEANLDWGVDSLEVEKRLHVNQGLFDLSVHGAEEVEGQGQLK